MGQEGEGEEHSTAWQEPQKTITPGKERDPATPCQGQA